MKERANWDSPALPLGKGLTTEKPFAIVSVGRRVIVKGIDTAKRNRHYHCLEYDRDQNGEIFLIACGTERCEPGVRYGPDLREGYHLHMVLSGKGTLYVRNHTFYPRFGQFFLLKDHESVEYAADVSDP